MIQVLLSLSRLSKNNYKRQHSHNEQCGFVHAHTIHMYMYVYYTISMYTTCKNT